MLLSGPLLAACGSSSTIGTTSFACEVSPGVSGHTCVVFSGPGLATTCVAGAMVPSCPTTSVLGNCSYGLSAGGIAESVLITYYSDGMVTATAAQMACAGFSGSTWAAE